MLYANPHMSYNAIKAELDAGRAVGFVCMENDVDAMSRLLGEKPKQKKTRAEIKDKLSGRPAKIGMGK